MHDLTRPTPLSQPVPRYVALTGPTASGKTAAALAVAQARPCEIISVDSALVYQGMDIGTAKPSREERNAVPHHLIDIRDPSETYSAADFVRDAQRLIQAIHARGRLPLLVGGTFLYLKALLEGLDPLPAAQPDLRAALEAEAAEQGWPHCMPNWPVWTQTPQPAWRPRTNNASSEHWRCTAPPDVPYPHCRPAEIRRHPHGLKPAN